MPYLLALAAIEDEKRDNTLTIVRGVLDLDGGQISDNLLTLSLAELIRTKADTKDAPKEAAKGPEESKPEKGRKRAVNRAESSKTTNPPSEGDNAVKTDFGDKLPWEKEQKPVMTVTPEELAARAEAAKDNLLNAEMEL